MIDKAAALNLDAALDALPTLPRSFLCDQYQALYRLSPPLNISRRLLVLAVGYALQERTYGKLSGALRRQLSAGPAPAMKKAGLTTGSLLIREWHGVQHTVKVLEQHFEYQGHTYSSLSAISSLIVGHRRSGMRFFGLRKSNHGKG